MVAYETKLGSVCISNTFFAKLIGQAVSSCYGVSGMVAKGGQRIINIFKRGKMIGARQNARADFAQQFVLFIRHAG